MHLIAIKQDIIFVHLKKKIFLFVKVIVPVANFTMQINKLIQGAIRLPGFQTKTAPALLSRGCCYADY